MAGNPSIAASLHHSTAPTWFGLIFGSWVGLVWGSLISLPVGIGRHRGSLYLVWRVHCCSGRGTFWGLVGLAGNATALLESQVFPS